MQGGNMVRATLLWGTVGSLLKCCPRNKKNFIASKSETAASPSSRGGQDAPDPGCGKTLPTSEDSVDATATAVFRLFPIQDADVGQLSAPVVPPA